LELLASAQIHPVVHVSQLKKHVPPTEVIDSLEAVATDPTIQVYPLQVLEVNAIQIGGRLKQRALVQWEQLPASLCSWEDAQDMQHRYATAWRQAVSKAGGQCQETADRREEKV
jgi:hypothetical protein